MVRLTRTMMTLVLGCLIMFGGSASAGGGREDDPGRMVAADSDGIVSAVVPDQVCERARGRSGDRGPCARRWSAVPLPQRSPRRSSCSRTATW